MADDMTATPAVADVVIDGLTAEQCAQLEGVTVGTLLEVVIFTRVKVREHGDEQSDAESEEEGSDDEDEGEDQGEDAAESDAGPHIIGDEANGSDVAAAAANADDAVPGTGKIIVEDRVNGMLVAAPVGAVPGGVISTADAVYGNPAASGANAAVANGQAPECAADGAADATSDRDSAGEDEDGDDDEEDASDEEHSEDDEDDAPFEMDRLLFVVSHLIRDDDLSVTDIHLRPLAYQGPGEEAGYNTYRVFGDDVDLHDKSASPVEAEALEIVTEMVAARPDKEFIFFKNPKGDRVRRTVFDHICPGGCRRGWLRDQRKLKALVDEDLQTLQSFKPLCPVCLGKDLMNEQILLRGLMDDRHMVDLGMVVEYLGRLNTRRRLLGYPFVQFDEREWGYGFDDMLDESGSEEDYGDGAQYEQWDEAMDPNANPKTRPASKATIASLPRKRYKDVIKKEGDAFCAICQQDPFTDESMIVELSCGHIYDDGCLEDSTTARSAAPPSLA